jgi:hypothetical protein
MHPLTPDLSSLSMDELNTRYSDLMKKMTMAQRTGSGSVVGQMLLILEDYRGEIQRRQQKMLEDASSRSSAFKNIIDIQ